MSSDPQSLLLHLPCNAMEGEALLDLSPAKAPVPLPAGLDLRPDPDLGRALALAPGSQGLRIQLQRLPEWQLALAVWIRPDPATLQRRYVSIAQVPMAEASHEDPYFVFGLYLVGGRLHGRIGGLHLGMSAPVIQADRWHHVAMTWETTSKQARFYCDGLPLLMVREEQSLEALETGIGILNYPARTLPLLVGSNAIGEETFSGRMAGIRLYERALAAQELQALVRQERHQPGHPFDHHHPLSFRVADASGHPALAIVEEGSRGRPLNLVITNTSPIAIELPRAAAGSGTDPQGFSPLVGSQRPTLEDHHLEVVFRPGTISLKDAQTIAPLDTNWRLHSLENSDGTLSLLLSRPHGLVIPRSGVLTIALTHLRALAPGGSRSSQVMLRYRHLHYLGDRLKLAGHRLSHLDVVNQRGRQEAPLAAGFLGSATVLNDGKTRNTLVLYLSNPSLDPLELEGEQDAGEPRVIVAMEAADPQQPEAPWALGPTDGLAAIEISSSSVAWSIHRKGEGETPEWILRPRGKALAAQGWDEFRLYPIVTASPSGFTNLTLTYQNIPGYRDGQLVIPIEKAPRLYRQTTALLEGHLAEGPDTVHAFAGSMVIGRAPGPR